MRLGFGRCSKSLLRRMSPSSPTCEAGEKPVPTVWVMRYRTVVSFTNTVFPWSDRSPNSAVPRW